MMIEGIGYSISLTTHTSIPPSSNPHLNAIQAHHVYLSVFYIQNHIRAKHGLNIREYISAHDGDKGLVYITNIVS